jgi:hypothetical protein
MRGDASTELIRADGPPAIPSPWRLTELDGANLLLVLRGTWVFDTALPAARMKAALAGLLTRYPQLAGRLARGGTEVPLTNVGVPFGVASRPDLSVAALVEQPALGPSLAPRLSPWRIRSGGQPLLAVRLTRLRDGEVLSVTASHAALDGRSFYGLVHAWGERVAGRSAPEPVLDQSLVPDARAPLDRDAVRADALARGWRPLPLRLLLRVGWLLVTGRLGGRSRAIPLASGALAALLAEARRTSGRSDLTSNDALSAHLAGRFLALFDHAPGTPCHLVTVLDARERVPALPPAFCGNAAYAAVAAELPAGASLGDVAGLAHDGLRPYLTVPSPRLAGDLALGRALVRHRLLMMPYDLGAMHAARPTLAYVNSFVRLPLYDVDLGANGRPLNPCHVVPHDLPDPVLIWPAPPARGGVEVYLTGTAARALARRPPGDGWWRELRRFDPSA